MSYPRHSFQDIARRNNFATEEAMLRDYYATRGFSIRAIAEVFQVSYATMRDRLTYYRIPLRPRGQGKN